MFSAVGMHTLQLRNISHNFQMGSPFRSASPPAEHPMIRTVVKEGNITQLAQQCKLNYSRDLLVSLHFENESSANV
jgi:hypothetical protein